LPPAAYGDRADGAGPWCADEYRWWQLELDDGMMGWSAEGDTENYFLEPVE
jgi:hypothetical protein